MKKILFLFFAIFLLAENRAKVGLNITNYTLEVPLSVTINKNFYIDSDFIYNKNKKNFFRIGALTKGDFVDVNVENTKVSLALEFVNSDSKNALAIGAGVEKLQTLKYIIFYRLKGFYSPAVLCFSKDLDKFYEIRSEIGMKIIKTADILAGYRLIDFNEDKESVFYVGAEVSF